MRAYCALRTVLNTGQILVRMIGIIPSITDLTFQWRRKTKSKNTWGIIGQMIKFIKEANT